MSEVVPGQDWWLERELCFKFHLGTAIDAAIDEVLADSRYRVAKAETLTEGSDSAVAMVRRDLLRANRAATISAINEHRLLKAVDGTPAADIKAQLLQILDEGIATTEPKWVPVVRGRFAQAYRDRAIPPPVELHVHPVIRDDVEMDTEIEYLPGTHVPAALKRRKPKEAT